MLTLLIRKNDHKRFDEGVPEHILDGLGVRRLQLFNIHVFELLGINRILLVKIRPRNIVCVVFC